jgi:hypothetical protein
MVDDDLLPMDHVPVFWRGVVGGAYGLALTGIWAWRGLHWAILALLVSFVTSWALKQYAKGL